MYYDINLKDKGKTIRDLNYRIMRSITDILQEMQVSFTVIIRDKFGKELRCVEGAGKL